MNDGNRSKKNESSLKVIVFGGTSLVLKDCFQGRANSSKIIFG